MSEVSIDFHTSREEWLKARQNGVGSSDAPVAVGEGYQSSVEWWMRKTGKMPPLEDSRRFRFGHHAERFIAAEVELELQHPLLDPGDWTIFRDSETPWRAATVDRFACNGEGKRPQLPAQPTSAAKALANLRAQGVLTGPVEMKTVGTFARGSWVDHETGEDKPATYAWIQLQHCLDVLGMDAGWVAGLVGSGEDLLLFHCERSEDFIGELREAEERLWRHVTDDTMPPVDGLEATAKAVAMLYPKQKEGTVIQLDTDRWREAVETRAKLKGAEKEIKEELRAIESAIKAEMGDHERAEIAGLTAFTWKHQRRVDPPRPEERVSEFRVFREVALK